MQGSKSGCGTSDSICLAAILKDEDKFVEEWVCYHRLLGIDHFYLYDNDPRQPLSDILALHSDYVTVRPWLVAHDDERYPGHTKQLKAYNHCLEHGARRYEWIAFLDGDEFIALEKHRDLKTFLAEFDGCDSISLNWHVFGHNGYYDDPPGLVIEALTRRMREPRAIVKSLTRTDAIASINSPHQCLLKTDRTRVDTNKRIYREALYAGKTDAAHINHYQCRSFKRWMQKPYRGEVGTFAADPDNAWRFSQKACLRQFVTQIAVNKNEYVDMSMARFVEPVKSRLTEIQQANRTKPYPETGARANTVTEVETIPAMPANQCLPGVASGDPGALNRGSTSPFIVSRAVRYLMPLLRRGPLLLWLTLDEHRIAMTCVALIANHEYARAIAALRYLRRHRAESKGLLALEGIAYLRCSQIETARRHWDEYWERASSDQSFAARRSLRRRSTKPARQQYFPDVSRALFEVKGQAGDRFCIFTALFGDYDELRPPAFRPPDVDFICFSDRPRDAPGWEVRVVDTYPLGTPAMNNRRIKILPYEYLGDYDYSLYVDATVGFLGDPLALYEKYLRGRPFVAWRHPLRSCVYDELEAILASGRHEPSAIIDQYIFFKERDLPENVPIVEAGFLWRDHRDPSVRDLMEHWWNHLTHFHCYRDQPALGYLMWKTGIRPAILPNYLGSSRCNEFTHRFPHKQSPLSLELAKVRADTDGCTSHDAHEGNAPAKPARGNAQRRLTWVYREKFRARASTLMRGYQLADIARRHLDGKAEVGQVNELDVLQQKGSLLILTKGFLKEVDLQVLAQLKDRGNTICADYVDDPARPDLNDCIDVYIASSIKQFIAYSQTYPDKIVHLITHHTDPRLNGMKGPTEYCNIGYFGEIANALHASALGDH